MDWYIWADSIKEYWIKKYILWFVTNLPLIALALMGGYVKLAIEKEVELTARQLLSQGIISIFTGVLTILIVDSMNNIDQSLKAFFTGLSGYSGPVFLGKITDQALNRILKIFKGLK